MSHTYDTYTRELVQGAWDLTPANLVPALNAAFPGNAPQLRCSGTKVIVTLKDDAGDNTPSQAEVDTVVADTKAAFNPLPAAKAAKIATIRGNTDALVALGALYNDVTYMSTAEGRFDVLGIFTTGVVAASPGFFPVTVSSTDGDTETAFADAAAFLPFYAQMMGTYKHWKDSSQALRQAVLDATTVAAVEAVTDDRTWPWVP